MAAKIEKSIMVMMKDQVGVAADISGVLSEGGVNLRAVCGWAEGDKGNVMLISDNNAKAKSLLQAKNFKVEEQDSVVVDVPHKPGSLKKITDKIKGAGVNISYVYATADKSGSNSLVVLSGDDNNKIVSAINN